MATKGKAKKGTKKQAKAQSGGAWPTMADAVNGMGKQVPDYQPGPAPKAPKGPRITPKFKKLR